MDIFRSDLRHTLRLVTQRPLFTLIAASSIALGIAGTTVIAGVISALLLRPPAGVGAPERAVEIGRTVGGRGFDSFSYPELLGMRTARTLEHVAGWRLAELSYSQGGASERIMGLAASGEYFAAMGLRPALGRFFTPADDRTPGAHPVVVLSHQFWQNRLAGDRSVLGTSIDLNRHSFTVIGIAPAEFRGHVAAVRPDVYFPLTMWGVVRPGFSEWSERRSSWFTVVGRLPAGVSVATANAELVALFPRFTERATDARNQRGAVVQTLGAVPGPGKTLITSFLVLLFALVTMVLLITSANVAGMLIARACAREREFAIRLAIGSGRAAVIRMLLFESILIFSAGGLAGLALARWGAALLSSIRLPVPMPIELNFLPDLRVLIFGLMLALGAGLLFGLAPALQASRASVMSALKSESMRRASRGGRMRRTFVIAQVALSLVLLTCAGLFLRSLQRATRIETGFDGRNVLLVGLNLDLDGYDQARGQLFHRALLQRLRALPGVASAGFGEDLPLDLGVNEGPMYPEGNVDSGTGAPRELSSAFNRVGGDYFATLRIPVLRGRAFRADDADDALRVIIVSRSFAEQAWPGQDALGKRVDIRWDNGGLRTVVGVVGDVKHQTLMEAVRPTVYLPVTQNYASALTLVVRGAVNASALRSAILQVDPRLSLSLIQPLDRYTSLSTLPQRIAALLTAALGLLALFLASIGVYGLIAFTVAQRTREIGTRMALGAERRDVLRLVVRDALRLALPGLVLGLLAAAAIAQLVRGFILGVASLDPLTFAIAPGTLLAAVVLAGWLPARRAARIQPMEALNSQ
jgi:predicted permease